MLKEYIRPGGYRIMASEKAYNLLYKKTGFVPVEAVAPIGEITTTGITPPIEDTEKPAADAVKKKKGKGKAADSKSEKATTAKDISDQEENPENETDRDPADQDAAGQSEGE